MEIKNEFLVPVDPAEAWKILLDIRRIMPCVPGGELLEVMDAQTYKGKVSIKLGPVALAFVGTAKFEELDEAGKRAKVLAKGSDAKGRGGANALVELRLEPAEAGTKVFVDTNVNLSGSVAQYGRGTGVIQGVASQLTAQFAENLRAMIERGSEEPVQEEVAPPVAPSHAPDAPAPEAPPIAAPASTGPTDAPAAGAPFTGQGLDTVLAAVARAEAVAARVEATVGRVEAAVARMESTAASMAKSARPSTPPQFQAKPISGISLMMTVLWGMVTGLFSGKGKA